MRRRRKRSRGTTLRTRRRRNPFSPVTKGVAEFAGGALLAAGICAAVSYFRAKSAMTAAQTAQTAQNSGTAQPAGTVTDPLTAVETSLKSSGLVDAGIALAGGAGGYFLDAPLGVGFAVGALGAALASYVAGSNVNEAQAITNQLQSTGTTTTPTNTALRQQQAPQAMRLSDGIQFGAIANGRY